MNELNQRWYSRSLSLVAILALAVAGCGGGGGGTTPVPTVTSAPTSTPTTAPVSIPVGAAATTAPLGAVVGQSASLGIPATASGSGTVNAQLLATLPTGLPTVQSSTRLPRAIGTTQLTSLLFIGFTAPAATLTFTSTPSFTFVFPAGFALVSGTQAYVGVYDPTQSAAGWQTFLGPGVVSGTTITFASVARSVTFQANQTYYFVLFTTGVVIGVPTAAPTTTPTTTPTTAPSGGSTSAYTCPSSAGGTSFARIGSAGAEATRRAAARPARSVATTTGQLAVTYDRSTARASASAIALHEQNTGATLVQALDFPSTNRVIHVLAVPTAQVASTTAALRSQAGVSSVAPVGRRYRTTVSQPYFPNDPYFDGFTSAQNTAAGNPNPSTFKVGPYEESANVPGQWDMHAIGLEAKLLRIANLNNGSGISGTATALGSSNIKTRDHRHRRGPQRTRSSPRRSPTRSASSPTSPGRRSRRGNFSTDPDRPRDRRLRHRGS